MLSTKEAATICKVALSTIVYWFDKGLIRGYRTPGGHRRIFRADLEKFMKDHAIPLGDRLDDQLRVLAVGKDPEVLELFRQTLGQMNGHVEWTTATGIFQAGRLVATFQPNLLLVDAELDGREGAALCEELRGDPDTRDIDIVLLSAQATSEEVGRLRGVGAAEVLTGAVTRQQLQVVISSFLS